MRIKQLTEFSDKEKEDFTINLSKKFEYNKTPYRIEVISSKSPINQEKIISIHSQVSVWKEDVESNRLVHHEIYETSLVPHQANEAIETVTTYPERYIKIDTSIN